MSLVLAVRRATGLLVKRLAAAGRRFSSAWRRRGAPSAERAKQDPALGQEMVLPLIDERLVESHLEAARSKFLHLKHKTLKAIQEYPVVYLVRLEWIRSRDEALARVTDIREHYSATNSQAKIILASPVIDDEFCGDDYLVIKINAGEKWSGDNASWDRVFNIALSAGGPDHKPAAVSG